LYPDTLLLLSGGIDSAFCMWRALSEGRSLHVHHVHLTNHEGRVQYEAQAVERILKWMRGRGLTRFRYTESSFDYGSTRYVVKDHNIWALWIGILLADPRNRGIRRVIRPDHWDSLPGGPDCAGMRRAHRRYERISWEVCERDDIEWEHPIQHMRKAEVVQAMPPDLLELCWYCRRPTPGGRPCHRCYTCRLVDAALKEGRNMYEALVIARFKDKYTKRVYQPGDIYRHRSEARMVELASLEVPRIEWPPKNQESAGIVDECPDDAETGEQIDSQELEHPHEVQLQSEPTPPEIKYVGGGYYELPDGSRVRGKEAAIAAMQGE